jgi:hypothetical protein
LDVCANPKKYDKSSKAMESIGAVETVTTIWKEYPDAYVAAIVTDEDATTRSKLSHSKAELLAAGRITEAECRKPPKKPGNLGAKQSDFGELPLEHPKIVKLSDPIHYVKSYKGELYKQVNMPKKKNETCKADAMRLSHSLAYMLAQHTLGKDGCTFEKFENDGLYSFEHHWNKHKHCGKWCQLKSGQKRRKFRRKANSETRSKTRENTSSS